MGEMQMNSNKIREKLTERMKNMNCFSQTLIEIIEKCRRDGQDFIFLECPHYYRLSEDPVYKEYHRYFTDLMVKYNVDYILAGDIDFDDHNPDYFEDMSHMSGMGRKIYTEELVKYLHKAGKETT
jgi:hypothetical protein